MGEKKIVVVGTDGRQRAAAALFGQLGFKVAGEEEIARADIILLPTPLSSLQTPLEQVLREIRPGALVFAGSVHGEEQRIADAAGVRLIDPLSREELAVLNAIPTCEGAIHILLGEREETLWNSRILILGFGRIAKLLAQRLAGFGALVTVAARRPEARALAAAMGYRTLEISSLQGAVSGFEILVNTVPALLVDRATVELLRRDTFVLDLASAPGGVDFEAAKNRGIRTIWAKGLPAKCAPKTAGRFLGQTVLKIMEEMEQ